MFIQDNFGTGHELNQKSIDLAFKSRVHRGLIIFAKWFFVSILCILVPVLHFFLVPFFLVFAIYNGLSAYRKTKSFNFSKEICPVCKKKLGDTFGYFNDNENFFRVTCAQCQTPLTIRET